MNISWKSYKLDLSNDDFVSYQSNGNISHIKKQGLPPLIFLNGLSCTNQHFEIMMTEFHQKGFPLITLDYRGHFSSSPMSVKRINIESIVSDVTSIIRKHKLKNVILIGHSMGANIAIEVAAKETKNVEKVVCIAGPASQVADSLCHTNLIDFILPTLKKYQSQKPTLQKIVWRNLRQPLIAKAVHFMGFNTKKIKSDYIDRYIKDAIKVDFNIFKKLFFEMLDKSIMPSLALVDQPILFIRGSIDNIVPMKEFDRFAQVCPQSKIVTIEKGSHVPQSEFPKETNQSIYDFLDL